MTATVTLFGDSICAGYGLRTEDALPARLQADLRLAGLDVRVIGAGVSGDATRDGLRRLDASVPDDTDLCVLALGANDLMQAVAPAVVRGNLDQLVTRLQAKGVAVLLCGMRAPPWAGRYAVDFDKVFPEVASRRGVPLYPFLLEGVALNPSLNLDDRIHPNAAGVLIISRRLAPVVASALVDRSDPVETSA